MSKEVSILKNTKVTPNTSSKCFLNLKFSTYRGTEPTIHALYTEDNHIVYTIENIPYRVSDVEFFTLLKTHYYDKVEVL